MGYSNVAGALNVFTSTSTDSLVVRGDTLHTGNIVAVKGYAAFGNVAVANLIVTGNFTITATNTQTTNALTINNAGTATALKVTQYEGGGPGHVHNVAEFWDFQTLAMVIDPEGNVAIHATSSPGYALTVSQGAYIDSLTAGVYIGDGSGLYNLNTSSLVGALAPYQLQAAQTNVTQVGTLTGLYVTGNVTASFFSGQGNALTNILSSVLVGNVAAANVALVVSQPLQPNITQVGTLTGLYATGNISAPFFIGGGNALSNIQSAALVGNVAAANVALVVSQPLQPNITQVGTLTGLYATGNISAPFFIGGGNALSNVQSAALVGNVAAANVALVVTQPAQPNVTSLGTLTGLTVQGLLTASNGSGISNLTASAITGNVASSNTALVVTQPLQPNITQVGTLTGLFSSGNVSASFFAGQGNALTNVQSSVLVGNVATANVALVVSQPLQPNITQVGTLTGLYVTGNISASFFAGQGNALTNVLSSVLVGNVASANVALVVSQPLQPNITQVGTLTGLYATGNISASFFAGQGNALSNIQSAALVGNVARANVALVVSQPLQPNITQVGTLTGLFSSGNVTASFFAGQGNALTNVLSSVLVGNVASANVALVVSQPLQSNITQVGTLTGLFSSGNVTASFFAGQGNALSNIQSAALVGNVASANTALVVSQPLQPNITSVGTLTSLNVSGNIYAANAITTTNIFTAGFTSNATNTVFNFDTLTIPFVSCTSLNVASTANISSLAVGILTASNGSGIANLTAAAITGNVANANVALVVSQPLQPNITQVGTLTGLFSSGNVTASFFAGQGNALTNVQSSVLVGNVASANVALVVSQPLQPNITQVGTLTGLFSSGNVTASFFAGQGNALTNVQSSVLVGNVASSNVALVVSQPLQPNITQVGTLTGLFSSGNVTASFFAGQGNALTNVLSSVLVGNVASANVALVVSQPLQPNITQVGTLTGLYATGNISAPFFIGGGNALSNIQSAALVGNVAAANVALVVSQPLQPNITQVGTLTGLFSSGNVSASFFAGQGNALTNVLSSVLVGNVAQANVALVVSQPLQPNITQVGTLTGLFSSGNVSASFFSGGGNALINIQSSVLVGNVAAANVALVVSGAAQPNITQVGTLTGLFATGNISAPFFIGGGNTLSNLNASNVTFGALAASQLQAAQTNVTSVGTLSSLTVSGTSNLQTLNVASVATAGVIPVSSGLFMNLNATYTLNSTGNWTGNIAGSITSNLFTLFGPDPLASWTTYGSNPLITGPSANGGFRFSQTGPYQFTVVLTSDNNIKTVALSSNTSDVHSNLADPGVWLYCYRISVGQDPSVPVQIPFYVDSTSKYYFIDFEAMNKTGENIHRTAYTNVTAEGYTGSYVTLRPL
jgi:hypothetical protein